MITMYLSPANVSAQWIAQNNVTTNMIIKLSKNKTIFDVPGIDKSLS